MKGVWMIPLICLFFNIPGLGNSGTDEPQIPDFSQKNRSEVPREFTWSIEDIYASPSDWDQEKIELEKAIPLVEQKITNWTSSAQTMLEFLQLVDKINLTLEKLSVYASLQSDSDLADIRFQSMKGESRSMGVMFNAKLSSMDSDILALGAERFQDYVKNEPQLSLYRFQIENILRLKDHILPGDQEKIVSLTGLFSSTPGNASGMLNDVEIPPAEVTLSSGKKVTLNTAAYMQYRGTSDPQDRSLVMRAFWNNQKQFANTHSILLDGAMKQHFFQATVRRYTDCLTSRLNRFNIDPAVYHQLINSVKANLAPLHRYLKLKQKMLDLPVFRYDDIYTSAVKKVKRSFTYDEAKILIASSLKVLGKEYEDALLRAFADRWVDIYPNKNKQSGAYSNGVFSFHPFIKMNYNGNYDSVSTLTHELGHAIHSYLSDATQPYSTSQYPIFLAEIASTFNENLLMNEMLKREKNDEFKLYILDSYLDQMRGTIYRQTLFAEFELAMHQQAEAGKTLNSKWLSQKYLELTRLYYGHDQGVTEVGDFIQYEWNWIPHFYLNYYVYQYSTGMMASLALSDRVLKGEKGAQQKYLTLLKSGGSDYPLNLLERAGVDMTSPAPFEAALKRFDQLVGEMERLVSRLEKKR